MFIPRIAEDTILALARGYPVVVVTGPRQSGKTTLARHAFPDRDYVSLEDPDRRAFAEEDPRGFLARYREGAVLDEVQRCPDLLSYLQTLLDADPAPGRFILTGSQQLGLLSGITQSLAGRAALVPLLPFAWQELQAGANPPATLEEILHQGCYPPVHDRGLAPALWYGNYIQTYVERDVRQLINVRDLRAFQRFVRLCAARTGQLLNLSSLANDCGITHNTAKAWLSVLEASYIVHLLAPHHRNFGKRLIKTPKLYFLDTGLAAWLLGIEKPKQLETHAMRGPLFETWVVAELLKGRYNRGLTSNLHFWRDRTGNEVDVVIDRADRLSGVEVKSGQTTTPDSFKGLRRWQALAGVDAGEGWLVYGGRERQTRAGIRVLPWCAIADLAPVA